MRSRLLCLLGLLLATATPPMAQTVTAPVDRTKGIITVTAEPTGACDWPAGQFRMLQATGTLYACVGDVVTRQDIPDCGAEAPTGACSAQAACQEAGALYLCNAGTWAAVAASGDMLKATYDVGADGTVDSAASAASATSALSAGAVSAWDGATDTPDADADEYGLRCIDLDGDGTAEDCWQRRAESCAAGYVVGRDASGLLNCVRRPADGTDSDSDGTLEAYYDAEWSAWAYDLDDDGTVDVRLFADGSTQRPSDTYYGSAETTCSGTTYYVDATGGSDSNDGKTTITAWQTLGQVYTCGAATDCNGDGTAEFAAGDCVLLKAGEVWSEPLRPRQSGGAGSPITFSRYGAGAPPTIRGWKELVAAPSPWTLDSGNVWYATVLDNVQGSSSIVKNVTFDGYAGDKKTAKVDVVEELDWYYEGSTTDKLYVYATADPATLYDSIRAHDVRIGFFHEGALSYVTVAGLRIEGVYERGAYQSSGTGNVYQRNVIIGPPTQEGSSDLTGISVVAGASTVVSGNTVLGWYRGIVVGSAATATTVSNNIVIGSRYTAINGGTTGETTYSYNAIWAADTGNGTAWLTSTSAVLNATDGGGNLALTTDPRVRGWKWYKPRIILNVDDVTNNSGSLSSYCTTDPEVGAWTWTHQTWEPEVASLVTAAGHALSYNIIGAKFEISGSNERLRSYSERGIGLGVHSWSHAYYTDPDLLTVQYTGASACTLTIASTTLTTTGCDGATLNIDLTAAAYDTVQELQVYIDGLANYTSALTDGSDEIYVHSKTLADVTAQDCRTAALTLSADVERFITDEIDSTEALIEGYAPGLDVEVLVWPGNLRDATTDGYANAAGMYLARAACTPNTTDNASLVDGLSRYNVCGASFSGLYSSTSYTVPRATKEQLIARVATWSALTGTPVALYVHPQDCVWPTEMLEWAELACQYAECLTWDDLVALLHTGRETLADTAFGVTIPPEHSTYGRVEPNPGSPLIDAGSGQVWPDAYGLAAALGTADDIGASEASRASIAWTDLTSYPSACSAGHYVSGVGDTLTCTADDDVPDGVTEQGTGITSIAADQVIVGTAANTTAAKTLPDCDGDGSTLNYDTTTHAFSCGDDDNSGGAPGGSSTYAQYNNAGAFAGTARLTIDPSDGTITRTMAPVASCEWLSTATGKAQGDICFDSSSEQLMCAASDGQWYGCLYLSGGTGAISFAGANYEFDQDGTAFVYNKSTNTLTVDQLTLADSAVTLGSETTGNYVASVATSAPLGGGAAASEGAAISLTVSSATTSATGVIQLAGDLGGSATAVAVGNDTHLHDGSASPESRWRFTMPSNYDADNDGTVDARTVFSSSAVTLNVNGADNESAIVYSPKYGVWIGIKNSATTTHGMILSADMSELINTFDFPAQGGSNVASEGVTLTDPMGDYFYISTEQLGSTEYLIEYSILDALAGGNLTPTKQWTLPDAWCNNANSWEGLAFVPDKRYGPTYWTRIPRGYFLGLCQGVTDSNYKFTVDTDADGTVQTPTSIAGPLATPCGLGISAGCGVDYDWDTGLLWWSAGSTVVVSDADLTCLAQWTQGGAGDAEGIGIGSGYLVLAQDAAGYFERYELPRTSFDPYDRVAEQVRLSPSCEQTEEGETCWDYDDDELWVGTGTGTRQLDRDTVTLIGDTDRDGTLELTDIETAIEDGLVAGRQAFRILPGTYTGGFRTTITIDQPNVTITGSGREATYIDITGDASGNDEALDDGDGTVDSRYLFYVADDNVTIEGLSVDGGSNRYLASMVDADANGTQDCRATLAVPGDTGVDCDNTDWCCPDTHDLVLLAAGKAQLTVRDVDFRRADRAFVATLPNPHGTQYVTVTDSYFNGAGEHGITLHGSDMVVTDNILENCGASDCILLPVPEEGEDRYRIVIADNVFHDWGQYAISTETTSSFEVGSFYDVSITGNVMASNYTNAMAQGGIDVTGAQDLDGDATATYLLPSRIVIADNQIYLPAAEGPAIALGGVTTTAAAGDIQVTDNRIYFDPDTDYPAGQTKSVIYVLAPGAQVNGNQIELDNAASFYAVNLLATATIQVEHVQANDNQITINDETSNYGIIVSASNVQIDGTHCYSPIADASGSGNICIGVVDGAGDTPEGVVITDTLVDGGWTMGVYTGTSAGVTVDGLDCIDIEPDGTAAHASCFWALGSSDPLTVRNVRKHYGGGWLARSNSTAGVGVWENLTCSGTCTCYGTACITGSGLDTSITADPDWVPSSTTVGPWKYVEAFYDCGNQAAAAPYTTMSYAADIVDADPQTTSTAQGLCRSAAVAAGNDGVMHGWGGAASTASATASVAGGKLTRFAARVRQTGSSAGSLSSGRKMVGGFTHASAADATGFATAAMFYACPQCDVDGDGTVGDTDDNGTCDGDSDDCNWWAVTGVGLTWGCLTAANVSVDCDDDGTAEDEIAGTVTYTDTEVSAITAVMREMEVRCAAWDTSARCTSYAYYIDGALVATHTTGAPTTTSLWGWAAWIEGSGSASSYMGVDWIYYRGRR